MEVYVNILEGFDKYIMKEMGMQNGDGDRQENNGNGW